MAHALGGLVRDKGELSYISSVTGRVDSIACIVSCASPRVDNIVEDADVSSVGSWDGP